eukprot:Amastigsp_a841384_207.p2 type:complete len:199 gc:universal Amastigsp_a841384_207:413-1009(+)
MAPRLVDVADKERLVEIRVHAVLKDRDVDVDDVAVLERVRVRDAVADDFVDRGADALGVAFVVERRRVRACSYDGIVARAIDLFACDADVDHTPCEIEDFAAHAARFAHANDLVGCEDGNLRRRALALLGRGHACDCVIRLRNRVGNRAPLGLGHSVRPVLARELEHGPRVVVARGRRARERERALHEHVQFLVLLPR